MWKYFRQPILRFKEIIIFLSKVIRCEQNNKDGCKAVSRAGHAFGAIVGLTVGVFILENRFVEDWEKKLQTAAFIFFSIFAGTLIIWHIAGGDSWFTITDFHGSPTCSNTYFILNKLNHEYYIKGYSKQINIGESKHLRKGVTTNYAWNKK